MHKTTCLKRGVDILCLPLGRQDFLESTSVVLSADVGAVSALDQLLVVSVTANCLYCDCQGQQSDGWFDRYGGARWGRSALGCVSMMESKMAASGGRNKTAEARDLFLGNCWLQGQKEQAANGTLRRSSGSGASGCRETRFSAPTHIDTANETKIDFRCL